MRIEKEYILDLYNDIMETTGGRKGIRNENLLDQAVNNIYQTFDAKELYPTFIDKVAWLTYSINSSHIFTDGNKRVSMYALLYYLQMSDYRFYPTEDKVIDVGFAVADHKMSYEEYLGWIKQEIK